MRTTLTCLALALAGCGDDAPADLPDAMPMADAADSPHCPAMPANPTAPGAHVIYLAMEGVTLTKQGNCSDSKTNCTSLIAADSAVVPRFLDNTLGRDDFIAEIIRLARVRLAPFSIDLVTERPTTGDYHMFVFGGDSMTLVNAPNVFSVAPSNCLHDNDNMVDLIFDSHFAGGAKAYASAILSDLGAIEGLGLTTPPDDCMCRIGNCMSPDVCTYGTMSPTAAQGPDCGHAPVQDEQALLKIALGCR